MTDREYVSSSMGAVCVCVCFIAVFHFDVDRTGAAGSSLCHQEDGGRQDDQQGKVE